MHLVPTKGAKLTDRNGLNLGDLDQSGHSRAKFFKNFKSSDFSTHVSNLIFFNQAKIPLKFLLPNFISLESIFNNSVVYRKF